jgi:oligopeptide/dipeptide ABC transporter ATP-binding protein
VSNLDRSSPQVQMSDSVLEVESLDVEYSTNEGTVSALRDISLDIKKGESVGLAGESGSGKSTLALAVLDYLDENGEITEGDIKFSGRSVTDLSRDELRSVRGNQIAHVPQNPLLSLNPSIKVGAQIAEVIELHQNTDSTDAEQQTHELLREVNISDPEYNADRYPHELSGGMRQRVLIAMALSCDPDLVILDEPTSGLDVTTEAKILDLINELKQQSNTSILLITHDLGVIAETTDRVAILYAGELMEIGDTETVFRDPKNPYTEGLLASVPSVDQRDRLEPITGRLPDLKDIPTGCVFYDRCKYAEEECREAPIEEKQVPDETGHATKCRRWEDVGESTDPEDSTIDVSHRTSADSSDKILEVKKLRKYYNEGSLFDRVLGNEKDPVRAVDGIDFEIYSGETFALVGESGCGKSTVARTVTGLLPFTEGNVKFDGNHIDILKGTDLREFQSECEIVFQNPESTLNPQKSIYEIIERPLKLFTDKDKKERTARIKQLLEQVELDTDYALRYPSQLSGGEKQRVAIARAFATNPSLVVLDEPVSALDVSVQASILNLLTKLREEYNCSYLLISHDLSVVNYISDRIAIMYLGKIAEVGATDQVFSPPYHPYTRSLLSNIPTTEPGQTRKKIRLEGDVPSARDPPSGCSFHTRCPQKIGDVCVNEEPWLESVESSSTDAHQIACHLDNKEMQKEY